MRLHPGQCRRPTGEPVQWHLPRHQAQGQDSTGSYTGIPSPANRHRVRIPQVEGFPSPPPGKGSGFHRYTYIQGFLPATRHMVSPKCLNPGKKTFNHFCTRKFSFLPFLVISCSFFLFRDILRVTLVGQCVSE